MNFRPVVNQLNHYEIKILLCRSESLEKLYESTENNVSLMSYRYFVIFKLLIFICKQGYERSHTNSHLDALRRGHDESLE